MYDAFGSDNFDGFQRSLEGDLWDTILAFLGGFEATLVKLGAILDHDGTFVLYLGEYWGNLGVVFAGLGGC